MGLIGLLTGWDQDKAAGNAVLASHLLSRVNRQQKENIAGLIASHILKSRYRGTAEDVLRELNGDCRVTQMNFVALACRDLGIAPPFDDSVGWRNIRNPYMVGGHTKPRVINVSIWYINKNFCIHIDWPGDEVTIDFLSWYNGQEDAKPKRPDDAKPQRGQDVITTVTVPPRTARGWYTRVLLPTGRALDVKIPTGVKDGAQLRLRGMGQPGLDGGEPGDALVTIKIAPNNETIAAQGKAKQSTGGPASLGQGNQRQDDREAVRLWKLAADQENAP